jgi:NADPH2:quinone reductase
MSDDYRLVIRRTGGPEVIEREAIEASAPGPGEARVRQTAIGLNFIDTYYRSGLYPLELPSGLGSEAVGVVEAVGEEVSHLRPGDRVAYGTGPNGAYATVRILAAGLLVPLPGGIDSETAAAGMLKGMTADILAGPCARMQAGQSALVLAASGGVGSILVQWLGAIGVTVIAHAGSAEKAGRAKALGAHEALSCPFDELAGNVRQITNGRGVDAVFDGVGAASWAATLASTAKLGLIVSYGNASGAVPPVAPLDLARAGSLFMTRPALSNYTDSPETLGASAGRLFAMIESGKVKIEIGQRFPLDQAAEAHRALEGRRTSGSTVLVP